MQVAPGLTRIQVAGAEVERTPWLCVALNKPRNTVNTRSNQEGRTTVYDFIANVGALLVTVGRLDLTSTGLLLMTNDTKLADWLTDPVNAVVRRYVVTVRGELSDAAARSLVDGIIDSGETLRATSIDILKRSGRETHIIVELTEGRNREIRRMLKRAGHEVTRLKRVAFGGIELGDLSPGKWRYVTREEIRAAFPTLPAALTAPAIRT